jgi:hypothetical protein
MSSDEDDDEEDDSEVRRGRGGRDMRQHAPTPDLFLTTTTTPL